MVIPISSHSRWMIPSTPDTAISGVCCVCFDDFCSGTGFKSPLPCYSSWHQWWTSKSSSLWVWFWATFIHRGTHQGADIDGSSGIQPSSRYDAIGLVVFSFCSKCAPHLCIPSLGTLILGSLWPFTPHIRCCLVNFRSVTATYTIQPSGILLFYQFMLAAFWVWSSNHLSTPTLLCNTIFWQVS